MSPRGTDAPDFWNPQVTGANFLVERGNVEFGVLIDNRNVTEAVERERVRGPRS